MISVVILIYTKKTLELDEDEKIKPYYFNNDIIGLITDKLNYYQLKIIKLI